MRSRVTRLVLASIAVPATALVATATPAFAHAHVDTPQGVSMVVGWSDEPTLSGFKNAVSVALTDGGQPVVDLGDTLKLDVSTGDQKTTIPLEPAFEVGEF